MSVPRTDPASVPMFSIAQNEAGCFVSCAPCDPWCRDPCDPCRKDPCCKDPCDPCRCRDPCDPCCCKDPCDKEKKKKRSGCGEGKYPGDRVGSIGFVEREWRSCDEPHICSCCGKEWTAEKGCDCPGSKLSNCMRIRRARYRLQPDCTDHRTSYCLVRGPCCYCKNDPCTCEFGMYVDSEHGVTRVRISGTVDASGNPIQKKKKGKVKKKSKK